MDGFCHLMRINTPVIPALLSGAVGHTPEFQRQHVMCSTEGAAGSAMASIVS